MLDLYPMMQLKTVWQLGSNNPENQHHLATIRQCWASLNSKKVTWQQRIITENTEVDQLDWEPKRFDEAFAIANPDIRGITLYWRKPDSSVERNTTPHQLILDSLNQYLYIFPKSQKELVIRVGFPSIVYETISLTNPQYLYNSSGENYILTLQDASQQLEVKVSMSPENLKQLLRQLTR
ncbi:MULTISPECIES: hypothetical protein [unclassified Tolypothrix]|uniref:hypothetical protein n=1 Tax=unclassified Tolypothrix TaxID=2649714 RepID=UPI000B04C46C|nr:MULTISPECIES: hypothetical protein [unclassified Tolypothrix]BAY94329.1 hypothetical protein NIES3275_63760 [Microchaete diplosiphon NIES-3275]